MSDYLTMYMTEKEFIGEKRRKEDVEFFFKPVPYKGVYLSPGYFGDPVKAELCSDSPNTHRRIVVGSDDRVVVPNPDRIPTTRCIGRIESKFTKENGENVTIHGTAFAFANNWLMTTGTNTYDIESDQFADEILYYPALGGNIDHPSFGPVNITHALVHPIITHANDPESPYNFAFLKMDEEAPKPAEYLGFSYEYGLMNGLITLVIGYPNDRPEEVDDVYRGTYMYQGLGTVHDSDYMNAYHDTDTSKGYEGAPMLVNWGDEYGHGAVGIQAYEATTDEGNIGIRINRIMYGTMKVLRAGGMPVKYTQPAKSSNESLDNISVILDDLKTLGKLYHDYYMNKSGLEVAPTLSMITVGVCNYLRHIKYDGLTWAAALLDPIDSQFVEYVHNSEELGEKLLPYINKDAKNLRDAGDGIIDLAHMAATLEGYAGVTPSPDFWTGWGADLASGMADVTKKLPASVFEINASMVTQAAYDTIGGNSKCNFSDFCCDFDAIKISQLITKNEKDPTFKCETGKEFGELLETYYSDFYKDRFTYIFSDLDCAVDAHIDTVTSTIYTKMTGADEQTVLLTKFGESPSDEVVQNSCRAFAQYILCEK